MSVKEMAKKVIDSLPDAVAFDDLMYALYVRAKFEKGESEIRGGKGVSHGRARQRLKKWLE